ncbi:MAPEG family protein [Brevirhabdus sp.]|uniref:MAPEG family protein n=1 Tax=Brevirhabdus sp. TaxID=2004514 RepID=UPI0040586335
MAQELLALGLAALLQAVQFLLMAVPANRELGPGYTMSARDRPPSREPSVFTQRMRRAMDNHFEGLILFTIAVVVVVQGGQSSALTAGAAWVYLIARVAYIPAYAFGWRPGRSLIWVVGFAATLLMILAALIQGLV